MESIVVLDGHALNPGDLDWQILTKDKKGRTFAELTVYARTPASLVVERAKEASVIIVNKINLTAEVIAQLPNLKMIAITATGTNNIDSKAANKHGILVKNVVGYSSNAVAQHVFALILGLTNQVEKHNATVTNLKWSNHPDFCYFLSPWSELAQKTLGIFGYGNIGKKVAEIALAFGMKVIAFNRSSDPLGLPVRMVSKTELLQESDILSLHAPLTEETRHFIHQDTISKMKPSALLINTARGALINEHELSQSLINQVIKGAALDVMTSEPPKSNNPLLGLPNCLITPHMAWTSMEARQKLLTNTWENILELGKLSKS